MFKLNFLIETNENATINVVDNSGNVILDSATTDEANDFFDSIIREIENYKF